MFGCIYWKKGSEQVPMWSTFIDKSCITLQQMSLIGKTLQTATSLSLSMALISDVLKDTQPNITYSVEHSWEIWALNPCCWLLFMIKFKCIFVRSIHFRWADRKKFTVEVNVIYNKDVLHSMPSKSMQDWNFENFTLLSNNKQVKPEVYIHYALRPNLGSSEE